MIVVKIELWPQGDESRAQEIGRVMIANDGTGDAQFGNYNASLSHSGAFVRRPGFWKHARVEGHASWLSPYHLVLAVLEKALGRVRPAKPERRAAP